MAKRQRDAGLRQYAVIGAEQRLLQIAEEAARIFKSFPELRDRGFMASGAAGTAGSARGRRPAKRRRTTISEEGRRRISEAQKARWAKQRRKK